MYRFEDAFNEAVKEKDEIKAAEHLNASIQAAQKCLTNGDFHKYREEYQNAYDSILNDICVFTDAYLFKGQGSIEIYALKMVQYTQRIQDLRVLLNKVNIDANKDKIEIKEN